MIKREFYGTSKNGEDLYITSSDKGVKIQKVDTDEIYNEAIDLEWQKFEYVETDTPVDVPEGAEVL